MAGKKIIRKGAKYKKSYRSPSWYKPKGYKQTERKNNNYKNGVSTYRKRALKRSSTGDGRVRCTKCGGKFPPSKVSVNHKSSAGTGKQSNNHSNKNTHAVCNSCHRKLENRGSPRKKFHG